MIKDFPIYEQITQPHVNHLSTFYDNICDNKLQTKFLIPFAFIFFILSYILFSWYWVYTKIYRISSLLFV